jgi:crossover junction endodeoxyribonuclease RuvC
MSGLIRMFGVDPGLNRCGWGVVEADGPRLRYIAHGVVKPPSHDALSERLRNLYEGLRAAMTGFELSHAAVEATFVNTQHGNHASALLLGHARGAAMLACATNGLSVDEISATEVKKALVGTGKAEKEQVALMVRRLLPAAGEVTADAADALAVAITATHRAQSLITRARVRA